MAALLGGGCAEPSDDVEAPAELGAEEVELSEVELYFPGPKGRLYPEPRQLDLPTGTAPRVRGIVEALLAGPENEWLSAPFPQGVEVATVLEGKDGVVIVDFVGRDLPRPPVGGSTQEAQVVWCIVNSITTNVAAARRVALLWNGSQPSSFGGHLDTRGALSPRTDLVQR